MTFLNPLLLLALPLIALPILIHLINQRRHRTIDWGAMMFLLTARKMSKGMVRLRQVLIMLVRMLAIAGLILGIARPLATGWFGALTGGKPETIIVLLDRSASMQQQKLATGETKISSGLHKVVDMIHAMDGTKRLVLIESTAYKPIELANAKSLLDMPKTTSTDASADIPHMMQSALDYIAENQTGRTDIWLCSDARKNDWDIESSRWESLKSGFAQLEGVRFHVLSYNEEISQNYSIRVDRIQRIDSKAGAELILDIVVHRTSDLTEQKQLPIGITIDGVRSVLQMKIDKEESVLAGHRITLDSETKLGWGKVEIPADTNNSDNVFYFCFADQPILKTVIVSDNPAAVAPLRLACSVSPDPNEKLQADVIATNDLGNISWNTTALLLWQAPLPQGHVAIQVQSFIDSGRDVIFFPPEKPDASEFSGASWAEWKRTEINNQAVGFWHNEDDLLQKTLAGQSLPLDDLKIYQYCVLKKGGRVLASLGNGQPLLSRKATNAGGAYFCSTLPVGTYSSLSRNGVVIYAMLQRALQAGTSSLGAAKQFEAGSTLAKQTQKMKPLVPSLVSSFADNRPFLAGVYGSKDQYIALNRPEIEGSAPSVTKPVLQKLFDGLDFNIVEDKLGNVKSLATEVWKLFIVLMGVALLAEAVLCLPEKAEPKIELEPMGAAQ